jgi:choline-sulfatase
LPDNFYFNDIENRPLPVQYICCSHVRQSQAAGWTEENYRHYLAAYYHYVQRADNEVGLILDSLEKNGRLEDTFIVFMADHGDGMGSHGMVTKQVSFYEETTHVPLVFAGPGVVNPGRSVSDALVSLLDLFPTLCDAAGLKPPQKLWGKSLMPWIGNPSMEGTPHSYLAGEWHTEWGFTIEPGRMIRTPKYKYMRYIEGNGEELYDMQNDPGETITIHKDPRYSDVLEEHRSILEKHVIDTKDDFFNLEYLADPRWRSHKPGYQNHTGPAAPTAE